MRDFNNIVGLGFFLGWVGGQYRNQKTEQTEFFISNQLITAKSALLNIESELMFFLKKKSKKPLAAQKRALKQIGKLCYIIKTMDLYVAIKYIITVTTSSLF